MALAFVLGLQLGTVRVEVKSASPREPLPALRGAVARRLLEDGYTLVGADVDAAVLVTVRRLQDTVLVVVRSGSLERSTEVPIVREDLLRLEVSHQVVMLLEGMPSVHDPSRATAAVGFRGTPTDQDIHDATAPLIAAGFAVVAEDAAADWAICVTQGPNGFTIARSAAPPCRDVDAPATRGTTLIAAVEHAAERLRADHESRELAELEALADTVPGSPQESDADEDEPVDAVPTGEPIEKEPPPPTSPRAWGVVTAFGGVQGRALDPEGFVGLRGGGGRGLWGGGVQLTFAPSRGGELAVLDTFVGVGPIIRGRVLPRLTLSGGVFAGLAIHRFTFADRAPNERFDAQFVVPFSTSIEVGRGVAVVLAAHVGATSRPRVHEFEGSFLWRSDRIRWGATLGVEFTFPTAERPS